MKIICIGRNYIAHAKELNNPVPVQPVFFMKPDTALLPPHNPFFYPAFSKDIHYEAELVIKINKNGRHIAEKFAHKYYDEISVGIDFTARDLQASCKQKGLPWEIAKAFDFSAPVGNFLDINAFENKQNIPFSLKINQEIRQEGNSKNMIFSFDQIIAYVSQFVTLRSGDLIFTGTPEGVGPTQIEDHFEVFVGTEKLLEFNVK
ncbi:MAG: fumarylacetoacetate hydrolase family protein [Bacteroidetes bacterium]|jgi:acylpyruvate hydrolase|nr:fumarylacetoacetate hydrolase family protein [Bacteroidota bacterium]